MDSQKKKILIVDDDSFLLDMYALKFTQSGFDVMTALGSDVALSKLREHYAPDIMLLDVMMPGMDGFELLDTVNKEKLVPNAISVFLSNRGQSSDIARGQELGAAGYIVKASSTPAEVIEKVNQIITAKKQ